MVVESIGIISTLFIVIAFSMKGELKIRIFDLIGAAGFVVYGFLIKSLSTCLLNSILIVIQIYNIHRLMVKEKTYEINN